MRAADDSQGLGPHTALGFVSWLLVFLCFFLGPKGALLEKFGLVWPSRPEVGALGRYGWY